MYDHHLILPRGGGVLPRPHFHLAQQVPPSRPCALDSRDVSGITSHTNDAVRTCNSLEHLEDDSRSTVFQAIRNCDCPIFQVTAQDSRLLIVHVQ